MVYDYYYYDDVRRLFFYSLSIFFFKFWIKGEGERERKKEWKWNKQTIWMHNMYRYGTYEKKSHTHTQKPRKKQIMRPFIKRTFSLQFIMLVWLCVVADITSSDIVYFTTSICDNCLFFSLTLPLIPLGTQFTCKYCSTFFLHMFRFGLNGRGICL